MRKIIIVTFALSFAAVLVAEAKATQSDACVQVANPDFHINYYELCGNAEEPVTQSTERSVTLWVDITTPVSGESVVKVKDLHLERSDLPGVNMLKNASFEQGLWSGRKNNAMCLADDSECRNIRETDDKTVWKVEPVKGGGNCAVADMSLLGQGQQSHMFHSLIDITGIPAGVKFKAWAEIMIQGTAQVRLGLDFRGLTQAAGPGTGYYVRAVNGRVSPGGTAGKWTRFDLR